MGCAKAVLIANYPAQFAEPDRCLAVIPSLPGRGDSQRQSDAARQALGPTVQCAIHGCGHSRRVSAPPPSTEASIARATSSNRWAAAARSWITITTAGSIFWSCADGAWKTLPRANNRLYRNNRDGTFTDVTEKVGLLREGWPGGVCIGDHDNDGFEDIFISYWGANVLCHNNGDGTFTDVTRKAGVGANRTRWGTGCTWNDYDRDGKLDLFVTNYLDFDLAAAPKLQRKSGGSVEQLHQPGRILHGVRVHVRQHQPHHRYAWSRPGELGHVALQKLRDQGAI